VPDDRGAGAALAAVAPRATASITSASVGAFQVAWQNRLNPIWGWLGGGCNLNRDIPSIIDQDAFQILEMETMYLPGPRPTSFDYWGVAQ
jgi:hypothetical protein